jgi:tRNA pseudouridine38-40 synthase
VPESLLWPALLGDFPPHGVPFIQGQGGEEPSPRRMALVLAYEGSGFAGWQLQPGKRTVQEETEKALSTLCDEPIRIEASGRTDSGVHALGQVASFSTKSRLSLERMGRGLASLLPDDVQVRELGPVPDGFHARFDCTAKTYHYYLWPQAKAPLFLQNRLWALREKLDPGAMREALFLVMGQCDLMAFASRLGEAAEGSTVRQVMEAGLDDSGPVWLVRITGSGFLRHVVRNLVGACAQVGMGRLKPRAISEMLEARRRIYAGPKAPAGGLYLARVYYGKTD